MSDISTGYLYDVASRSESLEEYKKLLVSIADQKKKWIQIIKQIVSENEYSGSAFAGSNAAVSTASTSAATSTVCIYSATEQ